MSFATRERAISSATRRYARQRAKRQELLWVPKRDGRPPRPLESRNLRFDAEASSFSRQSNPVHGGSHRVPGSLGRLRRGGPSHGDNLRGRCHAFLRVFLQDSTDRSVNRGEMSVGEAVQTEDAPPILDRLAAANRLRPDRPVDWSARQSAPARRTSGSCVGWRWRSVSRLSMPSKSFIGPGAI